MAKGNIVAICQFGGKFVPNSDGSMSYAGGEAHAIEVDRNMRFDDFMSEIADMWNCDISTSSIKYFLPSNKRTLITVSNDKDLQRMVDFHKHLETADVYVISRETAVPHCNLNSVGSSLNTVNSALNTATSRASRTIVANSVTPIVPMVAPTVTPTVAPADDARQLKSPNSAENIITVVGQEFNSIQDFRDALRKYAAAKGFVIEFLKNERARVTAKCKAIDCQWRIHGSRLSKTQKFRVRKVTDVHTCGGGNGNGDGIAFDEGDSLATKNWVVNTIKEKLRETPKYRTKDVVTDLYRDYGISLKYHQARRAKDIAKEQLRSMDMNAYNQLLRFCERVRETNPGSLVTLCTAESSKFHRLFISFCASQHGFEHGCRPLLFLNGTSLEDKYQGTLLAAASVDGDDGIFPVAFAIVEAETFDSWHWFLFELKSTLSTNRNLTFVSDRNKGLKEAVTQVFPGSFHGYCLHHLIEDFKTELKGLWSQPVREAMVNEFRRAAYVSRNTEFNACIENMRNVSHDIAAWVLASQPEQWSNAFFRGSRYDHVSSNFAALFKSWILEEDELSLVKMVDIVQCKTMEMIHIRRETSSMWSTTLTPSMEQKLQKEIYSSRPFNVYSSGGVFEVRSDSVNNIVNVDTWECSCRRWQTMGLPCMHAIAVFNHTGRNPYGYCSRYFTVDCYRLTYSESINPILNVDRVVREDSPTGVVSYPSHPHPPINQVQMQSRRKRPEPQMPGSWPRPHYCSRCKTAGHNRATCKASKV